MAERVENDVLSLEGRVLGRDAELRGKLRVATMDMLFGAFRGVFASFIMRYPSIELTTTRATPRSRSCDAKRTSRCV